MFLYSENIHLLPITEIIFNEFFDANYALLEDNMYWSTGSKPYAHNDVTNLLLNDNKMNQKVKQLTK
jgi:hypothetical protein